MRPRHRTLLDPAGEAVSHDEIITRTQPFDDRRNLAKIVALVGVAHDDEAPR